MEYSFRIVLPRDESKGNKSVLSLCDVNTKIAKNLLALLLLQILIKVKVKLYLLLMKHCTMKAYGRMEVYLHVSLTATLVVSFIPRPL